MKYDAFLLVSFGGPEGIDEVIPFLENVLRGKNVPRQRLEAVAHHYELFGGISPINQQNRNLITALKPLIEESGAKLPIYWGNRNWHPLLTDTVRQMAGDGVKNAIAFVTAAYSSYSSCRQYQEDILRAQEAVGSSAPKIDKLRVFYNHPKFIKANSENLKNTIASLPEDKQASVQIAFSAHSIPMTMAAGCNYADQLFETCRLIVESIGFKGAWQLVYQSRSGLPTQPWLEPDIMDHLRSAKEQGVTDIVVAPVGFVSDHMEVIYDLDTEAKRLASELDINLLRCPTVGTHPNFVSMIKDLLEERIDETTARAAIGKDEPGLDICPPQCCPSGSSFRVSNA
jgi:ferrochelatase